MSITKKELLSSGLLCHTTDFSINVADYLQGDVIAILPTLSHLRYQEAKIVLERVNSILDKLIQSAPIGLPRQRC